MKFLAPTSVMSYALVTLDGSLTRDPSLPISAYAWQQIAGPQVSLTGTANPVATFTAPAVTSNTNLTFQLAVTDSQGGVSTYSSSINVFPASQASLTPLIVNAEFLSPVTDNIHADAIPVDGPPLAASVATLEILMQGAIQNPTFNIIDGSGNILGPAQFTLSGSTSIQPLIFIGTVTVPKVPFRIQASGTTADGHMYSLTTGNTFIPSTFTVQWTPSKLTLAKGAGGTGTLAIFNSGATDTFTIQFTDPGGLLKKTGSVSSQIATGSTLTLPVGLTFPVTPNSSAALLLSATVSSSTSGKAGSTKLTVWLDGAP